MIHTGSGISLDEHFAGFVIKLECDLLSVTSLQRTKDLLLPLIISHFSDRIFSKRLLQVISEMLRFNFEIARLVRILKIQLYPASGTSLPCFETFSLSTERSFIRLYASLKLILSSLLRR